MDSFDIGPIKARLQEYFASESLNNSRFEKRCGLYNGFVKDMDTQIKYESLAKIAEGCPNLNLGWLFSGVGEMLIGGNTIKEKNVSAGLNVQNVHAVFITNWQDIAGAVAKAMGGK